VPGDRDPKPAWLWWSRTGAAPADVNRCWQAFLRRFDLEHTFRLYGQVLGWTAPKIRDPAAADRWTWLIIAAHTQLRLARPLASRPAPPLGTPGSARAADPGPCPPRGLGTSTRRPPSPPVHPNPANPALAGREPRRTATRHHAVTWGKRRKGTLPSRRTANAQVKRQAKAAAKITDEVWELLAFYNYPAEHWVQLRTTNSIEPTFAIVRHRTKVTKGPAAQNLKLLHKVLSRGTVT
jgi:hypothetical protein